MKCLCRDATSLSEGLKSLHLKVDSKQKCVIVTSSSATSSDVSKKQIIDIINDKFATVSDVTIPEQSILEVTQLLHSFKDENLFEFKLSIEGKVLSVGGSTGLITRFKSSLKDIMDRYVQTDILFELSHEEYEFTTQVVLEEMKKAFPNIQIRPNSGLRVTGSIADVEAFDKKFKKLLKNRKHAIVNIHSQYLNTSKGQAELKEHIKKASSRIGVYFYQNKPEKFQLNLLCRPDDLQKTKKVASDLEKIIIKHQISFSESFLLVRSELPDFKPTCDSLQSSKRVLVIPDNKSILLVGFNDDLEYAIKILTDYIESRGKLSTDVVISEGVWKLFTNHMKDKWGHLTAKSHRLNVQIDLNPKVCPPCVSLFGDRINVNVIMDILEQLKSSVHKEVHSVCRPGIHEYFTSDKGKLYLSGMETEAKVAIEISVAGSEDTSGDDFGSEGIKVKGKFETKCTAFVDRIKVCVCIGDITQYDADVIVNAANERLDHTGGVAGAIAKKGGPVIQDESTQHVRKFGKVDTGEVWLTTNTGNLPCKALVHVVGPVWKGGLLKEEALLYKACKASLVKSKSYRSIVFPAISSGIYGCPIDKCASTMIGATVDYAKGSPDSPLQKVTFIFLPAQVRQSTIFVSKLQEVLPNDKVQLTQFTPMHSVNKPANAKPSVHVVDKSVLDKVHLRQGGLLDVKVCSHGHKKKM